MKTKTILIGLGLMILTVLLMNLILQFIELFTPIVFTPIGVASGVGGVIVFSFYSMCVYVEEQNEFNKRKEVG